MSRYLVPLAAFLSLLALLGVALGLNPRELPSPLVGRPAPKFEIERLDRPGERFASASLQGQVWLLNVWASWCTACRDEHGVLADLAGRKLLPVIGLDHKDARADALAWLERFGDPYHLSVSDRDGRAGIEFGVYGVPETFLIDQRGVIRYKHTGVLTPAIVDGEILPLARKLAHDG